VSAKEKLLSDLDVLSALHLLPDSVALTTDEAAVILRLSDTTLERMRRDGSGPPYIQGGRQGTRGTNQKVTYLKSDLLEYQQSLKVSSSMGAAVRRGQAFVLPYAYGTPKRSDFDLSTKRAFYANGSQLELIQCVHDVSISEFIERLGCHRIVWLNPVHAAMLDWIDVKAKGRYATSVRTSLEATLRLIGG
jgi:hypothetical protein